MTPSRRSSSSHGLTAGVALVTALVALGIGVWENIQMREHNRLSVTPHLSVAAEFQTIEEDSLEQGLIRVRNEGVGPAVIDSVEIVIKDQRGLEQRFASWGAARPLLEKELDAELTKRAEIGPGLMFGADRALELAIIQWASVSHEDFISLLLDRVCLRIAYRSVYEEPFEAEAGWCQKSRT